MKKDFQKWHILKRGIHNDKERRFYHEREVWWCSLGENIGFEGLKKEISGRFSFFEDFANELVSAVSSQSAMHRKPVFDL